jgi:hypothetical protein
LEFVGEFEEVEAPDGLDADSGFDPEGGLHHGLGDHGGDLGWGWRESCFFDYIKASARADAGRCDRGFRII